MPSSVAARMTRMAISERFATISLLMGRMVEGTVDFLGIASGLELRAHSLAKMR